MIKPDKLNLKQWALEDRPREKMKQKGAGALTNAELLAILIHTAVFPNLENLASGSFALLKE